MAQSITIKSIDVYFVNQTGDSEFDSFSKFISNTRNPFLFEQPINELGDPSSGITRTGFTIDFLFAKEDQAFNEFILGIHAGELEVNAFTGYEIDRDSISVFSTISNSTQYFTMTGGYQRVFRHQKKLNLIAGARLNLGIPVSANTVQSFSGEFVFESYKFFARQSASASLTFPIGIRLKVLRNFSLGVIGQPTFHFHKADGSNVSTYLRGTNLTFNFKIRPK